MKTGISFCWQGVRHRDHGRMVVFFQNLIQPCVQRFIDIGGELGQEPAHRMLIFHRIEIPKGKLWKPWNIFGDWRYYHWYVKVITLKETYCHCWFSNRASPESTSCGKPMGIAQLSALWPMVALKLHHAFPSPFITVLWPTLVPKRATECRVFSHLLHFQSVPYVVQLSKFTPLFFSWHVGSCWKPWICMAMFELDMFENSSIFVLLYRSSSAITAAHMNAATHGTDIALPAILMTALSRRSSRHSTGDPHALDCCLVVGKQCDASISVPLSTRWCTLQEMDTSVGLRPRWSLDRSNIKIFLKVIQPWLFLTGDGFWLHQASENNRPEFVVKVGRCPSTVSVLARPLRGSCARSATDHFLVTKFLSWYSFKVFSWESMMGKSKGRIGLVQPRYISIHYIILYIYIYMHVHICIIYHI